MKFKIKTDVSGFINIQYYPEPYYKEESPVNADSLLIEENDLDDLVDALNMIVEQRKGHVVREGYTQSGRRKSRYCSVCGHTELQHSVNGFPSQRASVVCRKCNKNCNRVENAKFSYSRPDKSVSDQVKDGGS